MYILGIDPSLTSTGWAILFCRNNEISYVTSNLIKTSSNFTNHERLHYIHKEIISIQQEYKIQKVAIEETFVNKNPQTSLKLGLARGAIISAISSNLSLYEYPTRTIKQVVAGRGSASKEEVERMVKYILPKVTSSNFDEIDAIATSLCCYYLGNSILQD